jgi:peptidyl-prolyl cis-trans isomerase A (cyclophilin A)
MRTRILTTGLLLLALTACSKDKDKEATARPSATDPNKDWQKAAIEGQDIYATVETSEGSFVLKLFSKEAPKTVANFVGLASGQKEWKDPTTLQMTKKPLYDGTVFHRVIPDFMIQGGDPLGQGIGGPGYAFEDEFQGGKTFDKPGMLAMANRGPNTNGSQIFITVAATPWLNNRHTIFGEVVKNYEVVDKISKVPTAPGDKPQTPVTLKKVILSDKQP